MPAQGRSSRILTPSVGTALAVQESMEDSMTETKTAVIIATPDDNRCRFWAKIVRVGAIDLTSEDGE